MKYYRKQPVEAIQWRGDNHMDVSEFIQKVTKSFATKDDGYGNLNVCYMDSKKRTHQAIIPKFGWVVIEGKTLQFYKDETFRKTFKEADGDDPIWSSAQKKVDMIEKSFEDMAHSKIVVDRFVAPVIPVRRDFVDAINMAARAANTRSREQSLYDFLQRDHARHKEAKDAFDSVLDEMKELHAKKNKDYGDAAHVNFLKYGPVASLSRLSEKMQRAEHIFLSDKNEVKDEPLTATLIDMAITSAMLYMELKNKDNGED